MMRPILWLGTALLSLPALAQNPCDSLTASFQWGNNGVDPNEIFYSASSADATAYLWSFGDGEYGFMPQGEHTYPGPGTYELCLTVIYFDFNTWDTCSATSCQAVTLGGGNSPCDQIDAAFDVSVQGNTATFNNAISSNDYSYFWNFGDGSSGYGPDPSHMYDEPGTYYACLMMWGWDDQTQDTCFADHCEWVTVQGGGDPCDSLFACFQWGTQSNVTTFYNCSWGAGDPDLNYWWTFGDGTVSDSENPVHTFPGPGTYTVCLTIWPANMPDSCNSTICNVVTISGGSSPCDSAQVSFTPVQQGGGVIVFYGSASPPAGNYQWFFGDGAVGNGGPNTQHWYAQPGIYNVCMVGWYWNELTEDSCAVEYCNEIYVPGGEPCDSLFACFTYAGQGNVVIFDNCSVSNVNVSYQWTFGDGTFSDSENPVHTYPLPGEYYVCLTVYTNNQLDSCENTTCQWITIGDGSPCDNAQLSFTPVQQGGGVIVFYGSASPPAGNYQWFFGDGTMGNGGPNTQHWYAQPGIYNVCMVGWYWNELTEDSCAVEYCNEIYVSGGEPCDSLSACFQWGTQGNVTTFYNCSWGDGQDLIYAWTFGDGATSDAENPTHTFPGPGVYTVCLTIALANAPDSCNNMICNVITIGGGGSPCDNAQLSFVAQPQGGGVVIFTATAQPPAGNYQWFFGDGNTGNGGPTTQHWYAEPGVYNVCVVGWYWDDLDQDSCAVEYCDEIYVSGGGEPCDSLSACFQWGTQGNVTQFYNCSWGGGQDLIYYWTFGDGETSDAENPSHTFPEQGVYTVCLTIWLANSPDSCSDAICNQVIIGGGSPCDSANISFTASQLGNLVSFTGMADPPAGNYQWYFGDGSNTSGGLNMQHEYDEPGVYNVCLVAWYWDDLNQDSCAVEYCDEILVGGGGDPCDSLLQASFEWVPGNTIIATFINTSQTGLNDVLVWWDFGDNTPYGYGDEITHEFAESGYYYVCMYIAGWIPGTQDSCAAMVCDTVFVGVDGIEDLTSGSGLTAWPQPFDEVLTIEHHDLIGDVRYTLTDVTGRIVAADHEQATSRMTLHLGWLPSGHYLLRVQGERVDAVVRVMKR
jgi:PKD repeat protein